MMDNQFEEACKFASKINKDPDIPPDMKIQTTTLLTLAAINRSIDRIANALERIANKGIGPYE